MLTQIAAAALGAAHSGRHGRSRRATSRVPARPSRRRSMPSGPRPIRPRRASASTTRPSARAAGSSRSKAKTVGVRRFGQAAEAGRTRRRRPLCSSRWSSAASLPVDEPAGHQPRARSTCRRALLADDLLWARSPSGTTRASPACQQGRQPAEPADHRRASFGRLGHLASSSPRTSGDEEPDLGRSKVGASDSVQWPVGLGGKGNDGVAAFVKQTVGSIGYVEYAYAKQNHSTYALVQNHRTASTRPRSRPNFAAAASGRRLGQGSGQLHAAAGSTGRHRPGRSPARPSSWSTRTRTNAPKARAVLKFFDWAYNLGRRKPPWRARLRADAGRRSKP
jgi:hypothetical protein